MKELEEKKKRFKLLLEGKYIPKEISIEEAKKRLRETDPNIDISIFFEFVNSHKKSDVIKNFFIELLSNPDFFVYYSPLIKSILKVFIK